MEQPIIPPVEEKLNLDNIVDMEPSDLTDRDREYLEENEQNLTNEQRTKFGFNGDQEETETETESESEPEPIKPIEPDVKESIEVNSFKDEDDEDKELINQQIAKSNESIIKRQQFFEDQQAVSNIIINQPELRKYQSLTLKYMKAHPTLTAQDAMAIASAKDQQKIGAIKERKAQAKVAKTVTPGTSYRKVSNGPKDWSRATNKEVEDQIARAKGQRV